VHEKVSETTYKVHDVKGIPHSSPVSVQHLKRAVYLNENMQPQSNILPYIDSGSFASFSTSSSSLSSFPPSSFSSSSSSSSSLPFETNPSWYESASEERKASYDASRILFATPQVSKINIPSSVPSAITLHHVNVNKPGLSTPIDPAPFCFPSLGPSEPREPEEQKDDIVRIIDESSYYNNTSFQVQYENGKLEWLPEHYIMNIHTGQYLVRQHREQMKHKPDRAQYRPTYDRNPSVAHPQIAHPALTISAPSASSSTVRTNNTVPSLQWRPVIAELVPLSKSVKPAKPAFTSASSAVSTSSVFSTSLPIVMTRSITTVTPSYSSYSSSHATMSTVTT
jgi:hypothetical protein